MFLSISGFSQKILRDHSGAQCPLDSLTNLYGVKVHAVAFYYTDDTVYTEIQIVRPSKQVPGGKWVWLKPKKIVSTKN